MINSTAMNTEAHVTFGIKVFSRNMPRGNIAGLYCNSTFNFCRSHTVHQSVCTILHAPNSMRGFSFLHTLFSNYYL